MITLRRLPPDLFQTDGGLYGVDADALMPLLAQALARDYDVRRIDLRLSGDKQAMLAAVAAALRFPDWFGHNWDALADCLGDLGWLPATPGRIVVFDGLDPSSASGETLLDILAERADDLTADGPPLWMLVVSASPNS